VLGRAALRRLRPGEVLVRRWPNSCLPAQWFRLLDEDQPVVVGSCGHFFEAEEYEMVSRHRATLQPHVSMVLQQVFSTTVTSRVVARAVLTVATLPAATIMHCVCCVVFFLQAMLEHGHAPFSRECAEEEDSPGTSVKAAEQQASSPQRPAAINSSSSSKRSLQQQLQELPAAPAGSPWPSLTQQTSSIRARS
jgi:hypothetical protein